MTVVKIYSEVGQGFHSFQDHRYFDIMMRLLLRTTCLWN